MEPKQGQPALALISELRGNERVRAFDFFRLVRLLDASSVGCCPRIGQSWSPAEDPVRFCQPPLQGMAASTIERFAAGNSPTAPKLYLNSFGLFGPHGPMPWHFTEYARIRRSAEYETALASKAAASSDDLAIPDSEEEWDSVVTAFCDIFHHRLISFFYRAWSAHQRVTELDRDSADETDETCDNFRFGKYLGSLSGLGLASLSGKQDCLPGNARLYHSGWFADPARPPEGLQSMLNDFLGIDVDILSFVGRWIEAADCQDEASAGFCELGKSRATGLLGQNIVIGSRRWECQLGFRIRLGPMDLNDYLRLLPPVTDTDYTATSLPRGDMIKRVRAWVRTFVGFEYFWDLQLVLRAASVPDAILGGSAELGRTAWLKTDPLKERPFIRDAADLVFDPEIVFNPEAIEESSVSREN